MISRRKRRGLDPMIAMINMVFILLAFFLMGEFKNDAPNAIEIPISTSGETMTGNAIISISANGEILGFEPEAKHKALYTLFVDRNIDANKFISITQKLKSQGVKISGIEVQE